MQIGVGFCQRRVCTPIPLRWGKLRQRRCTGYVSLRVCVCVCVMVLGGAPEPQSLRNSQRQPGVGASPTHPLLCHPSESPAGMQKGFRGERKDGDTHTQPYSPSQPPPRKIPFYQHPKLCSSPLHPPHGIGAIRLGRESLRKGWGHRKRISGSYWPLTPLPRPFLSTAGGLPGAAGACGERRGGGARSPAIAARRPRCAGMLGRDLRSCVPPPLLFFFLHHDPSKK